MFINEDICGLEFEVLGGEGGDVVCDGKGGGGGGRGGVEDVNCAAVGFNDKIVNRFAISADGLMANRLTILS